MAVAVAVGGKEGEMGQSVIELNSSGLEIGNDDRY